MRIIYNTKKGNQYPLDIIVKDITVSDLVFEPDQVEEWCRTGCANFGKSGGCPPRAPALDKLYSMDTRAWLIACRFDSVYKPEKVKNSNNSAIHWKFQDVILANFLNNLGHTLQEKTGGSFLATGYCMGCPGKKCNFKLGSEHCRNPQKRTFSMEATGVNVVKTIKKSLNLDLYWYSKGNIDIPYMVKCMAFFPRNVENGQESILAVLPCMSSISKH